MIAIPLRREQSIVIVIALLDIRFSDYPRAVPEQQLHTRKPASPHRITSHRIPPRPPVMFAAARTSVLRSASARTQLRHTQSQTAWSRLASTLAVLEAKEGKLNIASLAAITAGTKLGGSITAFVAGSGGKTLAEEAGKAQGIEKVIYVDNAAYDKVSTVDRDRDRDMQETRRGADTNRHCRASPRTGHRCWSRTSRREATHTS